MLRSSLKRLSSKFHHNSYDTYNFIEISADNLSYNLRLIQKLNPKQQVIPVIKSNAFGHGIIEVAKILSVNHIQLVAVDGYFEAKTILDNTNVTFWL